MDSRCPHDTFGVNREFKVSPDNNTPTQRLGLEAIHRLAADALARNGFSAANAAVIADVVTAAERDGARSHGLMRIPGYVRGARTGRIDPAAVPRPVAFAQARTDCADIIEIDGGRGYAAPAVALGRPLLIDAVRTHGRGTLRLRNAHHLHALWWDVEAVAEAGYLALAMVISRPVASVFDGHGRALGTNPLCFAVPREGRPPLVADMATSASARGDIALAQHEGRAIPPDWAVGPDGAPTTDPKTALAGSQRPYGGGAKGSALMLMVEVFAAVLSGGRFGFEALAAGKNDDAPLDTGEVILAFDPALFGGAAAGGRIEALCAHLAASGVTRLPGDRRHALRAATLASGGVDVAAAQLAEIAAL